MTIPSLIPCDGCGQSASPEHISRRLRRLERATRFRPIHIDALLVSAFPPEADSEFLYSAAADSLCGEGARLLDALGVPYNGKAAESVLADFQRRGLFFTHVLECPPLAQIAGTSAVQLLLEQRLPTVFTRIRRSLKPKRVLLVSDVLEPLVKRFVETDLGCPVMLNDGKPFCLEGMESLSAIARLRSALALTAASTP